MSAGDEIGLPPAGLMRRVLSLAYEGLVLGAVLALGATPFIALTHGVEHSVARAFLQLYLIALAGAYFVCQWRRGGQTLPMKTWRLRLVSRNGGTLSLRQAVQRYCLALVGLLALGAGFAWAVVDRDHQFLHDRLAGTRIVNDERDPMNAKRS
jgi:uncharacterized RDD family membrane protein YckC